MVEWMTNEQKRIYGLSKKGKIVKGGNYRLFTNSKCLVEKKCGNSPNIYSAIALTAVKVKEVRVTNIAQKGRLVIVKNPIPLSSMKTFKDDYPFPLENAITYEVGRRNERKKSDESFKITIGKPLKPEKDEEELLKWEENFMQNTK